MLESDKLFIYNKFETINDEIFNIKCLSKILEELLLNKSEHLTYSDIYTLSMILNKMVCDLSNKSQKYEIELFSKLLI